MKVANDVRFSRGVNRRTIFSFQIINIMFLMINFICPVNFAVDITPYSTETAVVEATDKVNSSGRGYKQSETNKKSVTT